MHDGSTLTAYDVAYSISLARRTSRYSGRFISMYGASASDLSLIHIFIFYVNFTQSTHI